MCISCDEIIIRLDNGELPAALSKERWECKLEIVEREQFSSYRKLEKYLEREGIDNACPLCYVYMGGDCIDCPLYNMGDCCLDEESTYDNVYKASCYTEFVNAIIEMINVLDKAMKLETSDKNEN